MKAHLSTDLTPLANLLVINRLRLTDSRGCFSRLYCTEELTELNLDFSMIQINHSNTKKIGTARGLHYQKPPHAEIKIVTCITGSIFDVAVDLRRESPTFLQWFGLKLSADNMKSLYIPKGFAHGFQSLSDHCDLIYFHSQAYSPVSERSINVNDPMLQIEWPMPISHLSTRDYNSEFLDPNFQGLAL